MFKLAGLISHLAPAVVLFSTLTFAQDQKPAPKNDNHSVVLQTDSGRYGVGSGKLDPKQLGVAIYPGAKVDTSENDGEGANLSLEWGADSTHLYVQKYITSDPAANVVTFYQKQLSKYGPVLECRDGKPFVALSTALTCEEGDAGIELKSGTEKKEHVVSVRPKEKGAEFQIAYLDETKSNDR
jgi:hypothetical protein